MANTITSFIPGDLVISVVGDGDGSGTYTDNQATAITLEEINPTTGAVDGTLVLPQTTTTTNGVTESAISGEYGSSSEGTLELSADGHSLVIAGYGVNAATYNAGESNGNNVYGNAALAQSTSVQGGTSTAVPRVVADISATGTVDTSTILYNIYNTQNPRSVATTDGSSFYLSGQGIKKSTNQGVFLANDGASTYTPIYTGLDTRTAELYNGTLYVSSDSSQAKGTGNISTYGTSPTGSTAPTPLAGINGTVALNGSNGNSINNSSGTVDLSPENFFFANPTTLYVADSGNPKGGTLGDGGLQKWTYDPTAKTWNLQYTLSSGLGIIPNTTTDPGQGGAGTTGLIGLTGTVNADGTVSLYATNATVGDLNATGLYSITDTLAATTAGTNETFTKLVSTPNSDSNIRGVAFAPTLAATTCYASGTLIRTAQGDVAVETLAAGDLVVTASGEARPIKWLGHRTVDCRQHPRPREAWPVRIAAHAFGAGRPARDLYVSPGHAICIDVIDEVLIPAAALINGATVAQLELDAVTYWHVELETHDILLAENLPAESYLDMGNRDFFVESGTVALVARPDPARLSLDAYCRPFVRDGEIVAAIRQQLRARAERLGWTLEADPFAGLHLLVDGARLEPKISGRSASFVVPATAEHVCLASRTGLPQNVLAGSCDGRQLGVSIARLVIDGGRIEIGADDPRLAIGFHACEDSSRRWTDGHALLPREIWDGGTGYTVLRFDLADDALPRWVAPSPAAAEIAA